MEGARGVPAREFDLASQRSMATQRSMSMMSLDSLPPVPPVKDGSQDAEVKTHAEEFTKRAGMTPTRCYRLILVSLMLRLMGGCWLGMVTIEYARYYVINDLALFDVIRTATGSPQYAVQAFLFPFWGVVSDRVSRKKIIVAASLATCASAWMLTIIPSVNIFIATKVLSLVADVGSPIRDAMLRDVLSTDEWENSSGGVTGVKSRLFLIGQVAFGVATGVGMGVLKLGEWGYGPVNEYTLHKDECGETYCLPRGYYSWDGPWKIDGCLRLLMIMGSVVMTADSFIVMFLFPETLPPEFRRETSLWRFLKTSWREVGRPWNNLRVLATHQLRSLMLIRFLGYIAAAGGGSIFLSFYNRFEFDTFTMTVHSVIAGASTWFTTLAVGRIVDRWGDLRGIWVPGNVLLFLYGVSCALLPPGYGYMVYAIWPTFAGTSFALNGMAPELLAKLIPSDLQGTYQTARSFIFRLTMAVFMWPWNQMFVHTSKLNYPLDGIPIWVSLVLCGVAIWLTIRKLRDDPRDAIVQGKALDAFWDSEYVKSGWYKRHAGSDAAGQPTASSNDEPDQQAPQAVEKGAPAEVAEGAEEAPMPPHAASRPSSCGEEGVCSV